MYVHTKLTLDIVFNNFVFVTEGECTVNQWSREKQQRNKDCTAVMDIQKLYYNIHVVCTSAKEITCFVYRRTSEKNAQNKLHDHSKFNIDVLPRHIYYR